MQISNPFSRPANQDRKHFPLGTSPAKPAIEPNWRADPNKFKESLVKMLGSEEAAVEYIKSRKWMPVRYGWKT